MAAQFHIEINFTVDDPEHGDKLTKSIEALLDLETSSYTISSDTHIVDSMVFDLYLTDVGLKKIQVIKEVRYWSTGMGLKEAKDLVDSVGKPSPRLVVKNLHAEEAKRAQYVFETVGARVTLLNSTLTAKEIAEARDTLVGAYEQLLSLSKN